MHAVLALLIALVVSSLSVPTSHAAVLTLLPNVDGVAAHGITPSAAWVPNGCTNQYECVDEAIPGNINDSDYLELPAGSLTAHGHAFDLTNASLDPNAIITKATITIRVQRQNPGSASCDVNSMFLRTSPSVAYISQGLQPFPTAGSIDQVSATVENVAELGSAIALNNLYVTINMDRCTEGFTRLYSLAVEIEYEPPATATLIPNQELNLPFPDWATNGCVKPNTWQCIDEVIPSAVDTGDYAYGNASNWARWGFGTSAVGLVGRIALRSVARIYTGYSGTFPFTIYRPDGTTVYDGQLPALASSYQTFTVPLNRYLTQTDIDGLEIAFTNPNTVNRYVAAVNISAWSATVSGTVDTTTNCDGESPVVGVAVNGVKWDTVPCQAGTGDYAASPPFATGDIVTTYYDGQTPKGVAYTRTAASSSTMITGADITTNQVLVRSLSGTAITATDLNQFDADQDADIPVQYPVSGRINAPSANIHVRAGNFQPGADVTTTALWIRTGATFTPQANTLAVTSSGTGTCNDSTNGRPFCNAGTFTAGTSTVSYRGTGAITMSAGTYSTIDITSTASNLISFDSGTTGATANLTISGSGGAPVVSTSANSPTVNIGGNTTISGTATLGGSGAGTMSLSGDLTGTGNVNFTNGSVVLNRSGANSTLDAGGTLPGTPWQFATLRTTNPGWPQRNVIVPATSRELRVSTLLAAELYAGFNATALTRPLTVTGNVSIALGSSIESPPSFEVQGNFTNGGTFYPNTGTVKFTGAGTSNITAFQAGSFYGFEISTPSKVVTSASSFNVTNNLVITGGSCATPATLRSTVSGNIVYLARSGPTVSANYASFRDISVSSGSFTATNSGNLGGNANITFSGTGCAAPTFPFADSTNASAGSTKPLHIDGRTAFHMSMINATGTTTDRYRSEVSSSLLDSSVVGLWTFNWTGADRSATNNTIAPTGSPGITTGATHFNETVDFDGVNDVYAAPSHVAYDTSTFTVDLWMRAPSISAGANATLATRALSNSNQQFAIWTDNATRQLHASVSAGGVTFETATSMSPWLDNQWHHIAMTVDGSKQIQLYVDGVQQGTTATYTGSLDIPAAPLRVGSAGSAGTYFDGMIDDVQIANVARTQAELYGYARTKRPHAQSIWTSASHGALAGAALSAPCSTGARCADVEYTSGPDIRQDGARYFATHSLRTVAGMWTPSVSDWFETSDNITVTTPPTVTLPATGPNATATASFSATTACTNAGGCRLVLSAPSAAVSLANASGTSSVPPYTIGTPAVWATGGATALGYGVLASTSGKDTATWGTGVDFSNLTLLKFTGAGPSGTTLHQSSGPGSETTSIAVRLETGSAMAGTYNGTVSLIAMDAP